MLYRSKATVPFGAPELFDLVKGARRRNRLRRVTGALFYEEGHFFQWIEGPEEAVAPLFTTIGRDSRHSDLEVLSAGPADARVFGDWNLRLYRNREKIPERLHLSEPCEACNASGCVTRDVALDLVRGNAARFRAVLEQVADRTDVMVCYCEQLMTRFRELWRDDECFEAEIAIGYALALSALRQVREPRQDIAWPNMAEHVLVLPLPGEPHYLRAALATTMLESAGFFASQSLPANRVEFVRQLAAASPAGLVLVAGTPSLSCEQQRAVQAICDCARLELGADLRIAVYGHLQGECEGLKGPLGADYLTSSALRLPRFFDLGGRRIH